MKDVRFIQALGRAFGSYASEVVSVRIEAQTENSEFQRRTHFFRDDEEIACSNWTTIKRART